MLHQRLSVMVSCKALSDQFASESPWLTQFRSLGGNKFFGHDYRLLRDASCIFLTDVRKGCGNSRATFTGSFSALAQCLSRNHLSIAQGLCVRILTWGATASSTQYYVRSHNINFCHRKEHIIICHDVNNIQTLTSLLKILWTNNYY